MAEQNDKNCDNCFYYKKVGIGDLRYCSYIFVEDTIRPCPPGKECTVKIPINVKRRKRDGN